VDLGSRNIVPLDPGIEDSVAADLGVGIERSDPIGRNVHARGEVGIVEVALRIEVLAHHQLAQRARQFMGEAQIERARVSRGISVGSQDNRSIVDGARYLVDLREMGAPVRITRVGVGITERSRAEEALRQAQGDLARINRVTTTGELAASLAHELSQPISGAMTNANTCLRKLERDDLDPDELRVVVTRFARDAQRASDIIGRIRSLFARGTSNREVIDVNEVNQEIVTLLRDEAVRYNVLVRTELAADLPRIVGDRVQLQQVAMNLIVNGIEAMRDVDGIREIVIKSQRTEDEQILVSVSDTGIGFPPQLAEQIFDPFFTTKPRGTGMGLRICRSIIESHGGRLRGVGTPGARRNVSLEPAHSSERSAEPDHRPILRRSGKAHRRCDPSRTS
jgi:C4-dicarboxylate-specific signal transduction histidine kinase